MDANVEAHYTRDELEQSILDALEADGKALDRLTLADLAPVDAFHLRGREATLELADAASITRDERVLDVGCGLGGSARHIANECGCSVTGLDLTEVYCDVATTLSDLVGLGDRTEFQCGSALSMPFADDSFDCVWTEHAQMNIDDKRGFYSEIARVLRPGGRLVFHDVFAGPGGDPHFPVPWAEVAELSRLIEPPRLRSLLDSLGYSVVEWRDVSAATLTWLEKLAQRANPPSTGLGLLMGETTPDKLANIQRNVREERVTVLQCVLRTA